MDLRCPHKLHGRVVDFDVIEVSCDSKFCGKEPGIAVLHRYSLVTGELLSTRRYKIPTKKSNGG